MEYLTFAWSFLQAVDWADAWPWMKWALLGNLVLDIVSVPILMVLYAALTHLQKLSEQWKEPPTKFQISMFAGALWWTLKIDFYVNYSVGTKLFGALPKWGDWTLSQRMSYYWDNLPESSRCRKLVGWIERNTWLNRMDYRGLHIGSKP